MATDYEKIKIEMARNMASAGIKAEVSKPAFSTVDTFGGGNPWPHFSYVVTFSVDGKGLMAIDYYMGASKEESRPSWTGLSDQRPAKDRHPNPAEVLGSVCREALEAHEQSFDDWASSLGYDADSRKAEKIYRLCSDRYHELRRFMDGEMIQTLATLSAEL